MTRPRRWRFRVVPDTEPRRRHGLSSLLVLSAYWFALAYLWQPLVTFILPIQIDQLSRSATLGLGSLAVQLDRNALLGLVGGLGTAVAVVWQPLIGSLSDRTRSRFGRRRPYMLVGIVATVVALLLLSGVTTIWWLVLTYLLLQLASNTAQGPYQGMLPDQVGEDQRGRASAFYGALQLVATLVGSIVIGILLVPHAGVRPAILSMCAVLAVCGATVIVGASDVTTTRVAERPRDRTSFFSFVIDARRYPDFAWLLASRLLFLMALVGVQQYLLYYLAVLFHLSTEQASARAGAVLVTGLVVSTVSSLVAGYLSDRWGRKRIVVAACVIGACTSALLIGVDSLPRLVAVGLGLGVASGAFFSVDWAFAVDLVPGTEAGRYMGLSNVVTAGAGVLAGLILGPLIAAVNRGQPSVTGYQTVFVVAALLFVGSLLLLTKVREAHRQPGW